MNNSFIELCIETLRKISRTVDGGVSFSFSFCFSVHGCNFSLEVPFQKRLFLSPNHFPSRMWSLSLSVFLV